MYSSLFYNHQCIYCTSNGLHSSLMPGRELVRSVASGYFRLYSEVAQQRISLHMKYFTAIVFISGRLQGKVRESLKYLKAFQLHVLLFFRPKALQFCYHSVSLFSGNHPYSSPQEFVILESSSSCFTQSKPPKVLNFLSLTLGKEVICFSSGNKAGLWDNM